MTERRPLPPELVCLILSHVDAASWCRARCAASMFHVDTVNERDRRRLDVTQRCAQCNVAMCHLHRRQWHACSRRAGFDPKALGLICAHNSDDGTDKPCDAFCCSASCLADHVQREHETASIPMFTHSYGRFHWFGDPRFST